MIEGADATYTINKDGNLTMRADGKYKNFKGIEIDGKTVDSKNYTAWSGSTYVKFKKRFCKYIIWRKAYRKIHIYRWLCDHQSDDDCKEAIILILRILPIIKNRIQIRTHRAMEQTIQQPQPIHR